jgi:hypothetical protein
LAPGMDESDFKEIAARAATRVDLWRGLVDAAGAEHVAEIGVWKGDFAKELLVHCGSIKKYAMIDPWATLPDWNKPFNVDSKTFDDVFDEAMAKTAFANEKRVILRGRTIDVVDQLPEHSLDVVYIDGDHTLRGITIDLIKILPKVKAGGLIGGDDFWPNPWQHGAAFELTLVCPFSIFFAEAMGLPIYALPWGQFLIVNQPELGFRFVDFTGAYGDISLNKLPQ